MLSTARSVATMSLAQAGARLARDAEGTAGAIETQAAISLHTLERVCIVLSGSVDIFAVSDRNIEGRAAGRRCHVLRRSAGAVFGLASDRLDASLELIAIAQPGTRLAWVDFPDPARIGDLPEHAWSILVDEWVRCLCELIETARPPLDALGSIRAGTLAATLTSYHRDVIGQLQLRIARQIAADRDRFKRGFAHDSNRLAAVRLQFSRLLFPQARAKPSPSPSRNDALFSACSAAATALGIALTPDHRETLEGLKTDQAVIKLLGAARIRTRKVRLVNDWWRHDGGVLVGFYGQSGAPVALIPDSDARYQMLDSCTGEKSRITAQSALRIAPEAYNLTRPFPDRPLDRMSLARFALHGQRHAIAIAILSAFLSALLGLLTPIVTSKVIASIFGGQAWAQLAQYLFILASAVVVSSLFALSRGLCLHRIRGHSHAALSSALWDRLLTRPVEFFRDFTTADLANRALGINTANAALASTAISATFGSVFMLFNLIIMLIYDWRLAIYGLAVAVIALLTGFAITLAQLKLQRRFVDLRGHLSGKIFQLLRGIAKIRAADAEARAFAQWADDFARLTCLYSTFRALTGYSNVFKVSYGSTIILVLFIFVASLTERLPVADFVAFNVAFQQFFIGVMGSITALGVLLPVIVVYERARPLLDSPPAGHSREKMQPRRLSGRIDVQQLSYRHGSEAPWALADVEFSIEPGEFVAICGLSGSGKSTLLHLLLGLANPTQGFIAYDRQRLANLDDRAVREQVGVVLQNSQLTLGNLYQNITGGGPYSLQQAWEAAELVGLSEYIASLPMRMQTVLSGEETTLSIGQRQKLLLARAVIKNPRILMLDEATSALDNTSQHWVMQKLQQLDITRIVIAHRLSSIVDADRILVLDRGRLVQTGTFQELVSRPGVFSRLAAEQLL